MMRESRNLSWLPGTCNGYGTICSMSASAGSVCGVEHDMTLSSPMTQSLSGPVVER